MLHLELHRAALIEDVPVDYVYIFCRMGNNEKTAKLIGLLSVCNQDWRIVLRRKFADITKNGLFRGQEKTV